MKNGARVQAIKRVTGRHSYLAASLAAGLSGAVGALAADAPATAPAPAQPASAPAVSAAITQPTGAGEPARGISRTLSGGEGRTPGSGKLPPEIAAPNPARVPEVTLLSIDAAVQRALAQNPSITQAVAAIRRAEGVVAEARSFQLPRIDADARFTYQGPIVSFTLPGAPAQPGQPASPPTTITLGKEFTRQFSITGTFDPDPFGRLRANTRAAEQQVNAQRGGYYTTQNELVYAVQNVYLAALRGQELIRVSREAVAAAQEQLRVAEAQYRAGVAPEFDVLRARVQVRNLTQNQLTAEANIRRTTTSLGQLLSVDPQAQLELIPVALPPDPDATAAATARQAIGDAPSGTGPGTAIGAPLPPTLAGALDEAFRRRPEIYRAEWLRRAARSRVEYERKGRYPSVGFTGSYLFTPDATGFAAVDKSWSIVANISLPIWDAGLSQARTRQARADVETAVAQIQGARDTVAQEVRTAITDLEDAAERRRSAIANTSQAREALRIARVRYTAGLGTIVEVTDAETALTQAQTNEVNAAYDYLASLANLNRALGRYADDTVRTALR